jgi:hypothetical protein
VGFRSETAVAFRGGLSHRRLPLVLSLLAVLLCAPALWLGLYADDYVLWAGLADPSPAPALARSPWRLFAFVDSAPALRRMMDFGGMPWWSSPRLRLAFFRPLAGLTHWVDFRLWPGQPWLMHLQSLLWFGAAIAAATVLYRRLMRPEWVAGLAALAFAIDDAHASPADWIANRNATIATLFALLALVAHDRWRRDGWRPGAVLGPLALLLGLLGGEMALAAGAYLLAYALFLDEAPWPRRVVSLAPAALVGVAWALAYRALGFGATGSAVYVDPVASPLEFAGLVVARAPLLLFGQWFLPSQLSLLLSQGAAHVLWLVACGLAVLLAVLLAPLLRRDRTARFFALGMLLSILPPCSTFPHDRLLFLVGLGGAGLLAQLLAGLADGAAWLPRARAWRAPAFATGTVLAVLNLVLAPLGLAHGSADLRTLGRLFEPAARSLPADPAVRDQAFLVVQTPTAFVSAFGPLMQLAAGRPTPRRMLVLGSSIHAVTVERPEKGTLLVRPDGGYLLPPGSALPGTAQPHFDPRYLLPLFDLLYRDGTPMHLGERVELTGMTVEVTALTADGRPAEARFRFDRPLEDPSLRWLRWENGVYVPFEPPPVGAKVRLPPVVVHLF